ncbi:type II/IV secretion system ATPase subunit [Candidatus Woesearchaeota archaeon]|nr:type II/IV secretion system ATPase subunit [Candidatus Woesearchaeota archaeon]
MALFGSSGDSKKFKSSFKIDLFPKLSPIPKFNRREEIDVRYPLLSPYAFVHIHWGSERNDLLYEVEEPVLSETEKEVFNLIKLGLEEMINISFVKATKDNLIIEYLERNVQSILVELGTKVSEESYNKIMYYVYRDFVGLNEIEPLLHDYYIEDIECNGVGFPIYIVHRSFENIATNVIFPKHSDLTSFVEKLAQKSGRYVSYAKPLLDGTLPDGSRVNATYSDDVTTRGPTFTIRKFTKEPWTPIHLLRQGTANAEIFAYLWLAIEYKMNIMVVGETASGKTTFLNSIVNFIPPDARICSIEDTRELNLAHENWLPAVSRSGFGVPNMLGQQFGEVSLFDLLKESFRQNPDYVIVGEVRGEEASVLFQGMASGHPSFGTFHAGSVNTLLRRLQTPPINLSSSLVESLDVIVIASHIRDAEHNFRRIKSVNELLEVKNLGSAAFKEVFTWDPAKDEFKFNKPSNILKKISKNTGKKESDLTGEFEVRIRILQALFDKEVFNFKEFAQVISDYYTMPEKVVAKYGAVISSKK